MDCTLGPAYIPIALSSTSPRFLLQLTRPWSYHDSIIGESVVVCMRNSFSTLGLSLLCVLLLLSCTSPEPPSITLYRAIHAGDLDQIKRHIQHGTDINQADRDGQMPLHVAARKGRQVITRLLVQNGADIEAKNLQGLTPLEVAVLAGKVQTARMLLKQGAALDAQQLLLKAIDADANFRDVFKFLVSQGANVNADLANGETPLFRAIGTGHLIVVKRLIDEGADVNHVIADGSTPLSYARQKADPDIIRMLKRFGAEERP